MSDREKFFRNANSSTQKQWLEESPSFHQPNLMGTVTKEPIIQEVPGSRVFPTGARRDDDANKPKPMFFPRDMLYRVLWLYEKGAQRHGDNNWREGIPSTECMNSADRHWTGYFEGDMVEDHLAAVVFNMMTLIYNEEKMWDNPDVYDMPKFWLEKGFWTQEQYDAHFKMLRENNGMVFGPIRQEGLKNVD